jgi:hypothetical protein
MEKEYSSIACYEADNDMVITNCIAYDCLGNPNIIIPDDLRHNGVWNPSKYRIETTENYQMNNCYLQV